jgi:hypothetical protein
MGLRFGRNYSQSGQRKARGSPEGDGALLPRLRPFQSNPNRI